MPKVRIPNVGVVNFPDSMPPDQIAKEAARLAGGPAQEPAPPPQEAMAAIPVLGPTGTPLPINVTSPEVLGALGGMIPGPAGIAGAGGGGAVGSALEQVKASLLGMPTDPSQIAGDAATQAGVQAAGGLIGKGVGYVAKGMMSNVLKAPQGLAQDFPNIVQTALDKRIPVGKFIHRGSDVVSKMRTEAAGRTKDLLKAANQARIRISISEIARPVIAAEQAAAERVLTQSEVDAIIQAVKNRAQEMLGSRRVATNVVLGPRLRMTQSKALKQVAQSMSKNALRAQRMGQLVTGNPELDANIAKGVQAAMEDQLTDRVARNLGRPAGIKQLEKDTQALIGVQRAVQGAESRMAPTPVPISPISFGPFTPSLPLPPALASRIALRLWELQYPAAQIPRAIGAAIQE